MVKLQELVAQWWWLGIVVLLGWFWLRAHDDAVRALAQVKEYAKQVDSLEKEQIKIEKNHQRTLDSVATVKKRLERENMKLQEETAEIQAQSDSMIHEFRATLDSSQQVGFDSIQSAYNDLIGMKDAQIANLRQIIIGDSLLIGAKDGVINGLHNINASLQKEVDAYHKASRPSVGKTISKYAPWAITAAVLILK